jgi:3'(2'), 5'-bisphosphate nucleotidase
VTAFPADHADATRIATAAGELLLGLRHALEAGDLPDEEAKALRDRGDREAHELIVAELARTHPDDAVLSEEGARDPARLTASRVWIVDPLDGTREFGEAGRDDWAVHVALVEDGVPTAGAVALPAQGRTLSTEHPPAAPPTTDRLRFVVSRTRRPAPILAAAEALGAELVEMGSAGAKAMAVVLGDVEVYAHTGGQYEWDSAAPVAVAAAAGLHVSRMDGSPLRYNEADPYLPDLLVCRPELADRVLAAYAEAVAAG